MGEDVGLGLAEAVALAVIDSTSMPGMRARARRGPTMVQPGASLISRLPPTWSPRWWVFRIWVIFQRRLAASASTGPATAGSTTPTEPLCGSRINHT